MTTSAPGTNRRSKMVVLAASVALMLSLLPFASVFAAVPAVQSVNRNSATPTTAASVAWTVTFSESVTGVDTSDFTLISGGSASGSVASVSAGPAATYTVTVDTVAGDGTLCVNVVDDDTIVSVSSADPLATGFTCTQSYTIDNTTPGAPGTPDLEASSDLGTSPTDNYTSDTTPTFTGTAEAGALVELFAGATSVGTSTASGGGAWTITSSVLAPATYSFTAVQTDAAGNGPSAASTALSGVVIDTAVPAAPSQPNLDASSDSGPSATDDITNDTTPTFSGTAGAGTTVELFAGATSVGTAVASGGGAWQITSSALTAGTYAITAKATNQAGTSAASAALSVTIQTALTVTINQASGQADPTGVSPINFTVVFSNSVTNFVNTDVTITGTAGGTKSVTLSGSGTTYNAAVSGMTSGGTVIANIAAGAASDSAGNLNTVATFSDNQVTWDPTPGPTVTINQAAGQADPTSTSPINFTVVFSATVTGFTGSDVVITGTATGTKTVTITGAGPTYTAAVSGMTSSGTVIATIPAGAAVSTSGNHPTQASTSSDNSVTFRQATKWIVTASNSSPNPGTVVTISAQLADAANAAVPTSGVVVTWSKTGTGGSFATATSTTNASGIATVAFTVSTTPGTIHTVTATSAGGITGTSGNITVTLVSATLTLSSSTAITTYRQFVTLSAQFSGSLGGNRVVSLQRMTRLLPGTWVTIGTATTNSAGHATFSYGPPYNTQFRVVFAGATDLATATSNTVNVNVRHRVSLRPGAGTTTIVRPGTRITYTAVVRPIAPAGAQRVTFLLYKKVNGVWTFRTSATVSATAGVATFSWRWSRGDWYIRARGNATIYNLAALSSPAKVTAR